MPKTPTTSTPTSGAISDSEHNIDTLLFADWIITVDADDTTLQNHALAINKGCIVDILPSAQASAQYNAETEHQLSGQALIPGLINAHTHAAMTLFRGLADDLPLMEWLEGHIWPAERKWVSDEFVHDGSLHAAAEMIRSGTTCFNDMYFFPDITARVVDNVGMRAIVGLILIDFPTIWANDADEYISKGLAVYDHYRSNPRVMTAFAPHAPYTVSDQPLQHIAALAEEMDIPIHMHVHETAFEVKQAIEQTSRRPLQRLHEKGIVTPRLLAVHMTQLNNEEIRLVAENNASIVHCPESNLKLASGHCPVQQLISAGINVALGTDGAASNNDLDMLGEMRTAALLAKAVANDASALPAHQALRMATINGAKALGMEKTIGSLETGKSADIVSIDINNIETHPIYHIISQLVYSTTRNQVNNVWVAGKQLLKDKTLTTIEEEHVLTKAVEWQEKIKQYD
ncbi:MAG: TRZ/ATZ family hydrolase [Gammaproteobacteria bacterium]|nr:TRZ/ATZ family hydrolase [Gammaproteobacteria bacterium]